MKQFLFCCLIFAVTINVSGQKKAVVTESGKEVLLFDDGTWKYVFDDPSGSVKIDTIIMSKPKESGYFIESIKLKYGVWINKKRWTFQKSVSDGTIPSEYTFKLNGEDAYGMIIAEKIEIPIDNLLDIAFQHAKNAATDAKIIKQECRKVNGKVIHFMQMEGTLQGIKFVYLGYYYSDSNGSVQFLTYTSKNLLSQYKEEMESLLNGFIIKD